jgi:hypothetical protein
MSYVPANPVGSASAIVNDPLLTAPDQAQQTHWISLHWERYALAIPQHEVRSVEIAADVVEAMPNEGPAGWYPSQPKPFPIYRFDDRMWLVRGFKRDGFVMLINDTEPWGIWGEAVNVEKDSGALQAANLPPLFQRTFSPAESLAVTEEGRPVLLCSAASLKRWVQALMARRNK